MNSNNLENYKLIDPTDDEEWVISLYQISKCENENIDIIRRIVSNMKYSTRFNYTQIINNFENVEMLKPFYSVQLRRQTHIYCIFCNTVSPQYNNVNFYNTEIKKKKVYLCRRCYKAYYVDIFYSSGLYDVLPIDIIKYIITFFGN
jgi:hypothetical protein